MLLRQQIITFRREEELIMDFITIDSFKLETNQIGLMKPLL